MVRIDVQSHTLVPRHVLMTPEEVEELMNGYGIRKDQLPKILIRDPVIRAIGGNVGDVVRIERDSHTAGSSVAYRLVIEG